MLDNISATVILQLSASSSGTSSQEGW